MGKKISKHLEYPSLLDMGAYQNQKDNFLGQCQKYRLIGLSEHVGYSGNSGHYTAHTLREGNWYKFDDEFFKRVSEKDAFKREAYLLFY